VVAADMTSDNDRHRACNASTCGRLRREATPRKFPHNASSTFSEAGAAPVPGELQNGARSHNSMRL